MKSNFVVTVAHKSSFPEPIQLSAGDRVTLGKRDEDYPGWIRVTLRSGREGWAPVSVIEFGSTTQGVALEAYDATELDTRVGERVRPIEELHGWVWVESDNGDRGWIPTNTISEVQAE